MIKLLLTQLACKPEFTHRTRILASSELTIVKPVLQAILLAEHVYEVKGGKKIIVGTFNRLFISRQPQVRNVELPNGQRTQAVRGGSQMGCPYVYISLTDVCDNTNLELQIVSLSRNVVIFRAPFILRSSNRLATIEFFAPLPPLETFVNEAGAYAVQAICDGEILGSHRLQVIDHDEKGEGK